MMSGVELNPEFAAELASNVYLIKDDFSRKGFGRFNPEVHNDLSCNSSHMFRHYFSGRLIS